ncbi:MAG: hypothetical protein ACO20G_10985, partial [Ilumatobacteraceae bacterium]
LGGGSGSGDADVPAEEPADEPMDPVVDDEEPVVEEPVIVESAPEAPAEEDTVAEADVMEAADEAPAVSEEPAGEADAPVTEAAVTDTAAVDESDSMASDDDVIVLSGSTNGETITVQETIIGTFTPAEDAGTVAAPVNNSSVSQSASVDRAVEMAVETAAEAQSETEAPQLRVVDGTEVFADLALDAPAADDADEPSDDDANSAGGRGIGTLIAALGLLVLGGGGATAAGVKVLRNRD